ncbi:MAG: hypothetical protein SF053_06825 [Bacteroidia bacterium]|nr:hypothetical protein [Bacteroidia bacterium]
MLPFQTAAIFEHLSKGLFLSANSHYPDHAALYRQACTHFEALRNHFLPLGLILCQERDFIYLAREESKSSQEEKLTRLLRVAQMVAFCREAMPDFYAGYSFGLAALQRICESRPALRRQLDQLMPKSQQDTLDNKLRALMRALERDSLLESDTTTPDAFTVRSAIGYLDQVINQLYAVTEKA